jgi:hypothetical protein
VLCAPLSCPADTRSILIFTISAANSDQYIATRTLYGMAKDGNAPRIFTKCTKRGVPWVAFIFTGMFMGLAFLVASDDALTVFNYFTSAVTIFVSGNYLPYRDWEESQSVACTSGIDLIVPRNTCADAPAGLAHLDLDPREPRRLHAGYEGPGHLERHAPLQGGECAQHLRDPASILLNASQPFQPYLTYFALFCEYSQETPSTLLATAYATLSHLPPLFLQGL